MSMSIGWQVQAGTQETEDPRGKTGATYSIYMGNDSVSKMSGQTMLV